MPAAADETDGAHGGASKLIDEGNALEDCGRLDEARRCYEAAIAASPDLARAHINYGNALMRAGELDAALAAFGTAIANDPACAPAHFNMGNAYVASRRYDAARRSYEAAISCRPGFAEAHMALGYVFDELRQLAPAEASYRRAIDARPDYAQAHSNLGNTLRLLGRLDEAEASFRHALALDPRLAASHNNLGNVLQDLGRIDEAITHYRRAIELDPGLAVAYTSLLFCLAHDASVGVRELFDAHCEFGRRFETPLIHSWPRHRNSRDPNRKLHVGLVSGDLRDHAVAYFIEPVLAQLARSPALSLHAYYNHATEGAATPRLRSLVHRWSAIAELDDAALAQRIADDGIDILIDLSGHTAENRLLTFARKPAPVQASWLGYPLTTGLRAIDYYLADPHFLPPGQFDDQFTERLVYLPANVPFQPEKHAPPVNALPALENGYVTFASFSRVNKLNRSTIAMWSRLLRALPDSRMLLGSMPAPGEYAPLVEALAREGIDRRRLEFEPRCAMTAYLAHHHRVDLCLDTVPYAGGTTPLHALWMGVPTLTCASATPPSRQGAAMLSHVGLSGFIAGDADSFERIGVARATDVVQLAELRAQLRQRWERSAISKPEQVAAALEYALRAMWRAWCTGRPPHSIDASTVTLA